MNQTKPSGKMWMWGTVIVIALFITFFASFAIWTFQDDVELVYDNYYAKDVVYGQQIARIERTDALSSKPVASYNKRSELLTLRFPAEIKHDSPAGELLMFRPADLHKDRLFSLDLEGDTLQVISLPQMDPGLWRVRLNWTSGGLEYYLDQILMVR